MSDPVSVQPDDRMPAIELVDVTKRYGEVTALSSFSLDIFDGEMLVLLGPSGCGKSTILKIIAGLEDATEGDVYINGKLASYTRPRQRDVAMVFQNYALYPHMRIRDNIGFPLRVRGVKREAINDVVTRVARQLGLEAQLEKFPEQLSGGQRQRVALGRAIIRDPVAFLMDEPLSNLDALLRVQMRTELLELHRTLGRTTVYVTHDQVEAMILATRIVVMDVGVIQQVGSPTDVYARPANTFVAAFVGSPQMNLLSGEADRGPESAVFRGVVDIGLGGLKAPSGPVTIGIRPEDIVIEASAEGQSISGLVELIEPVGSDTFLRIGIGEGVAITARVRADSSVQEGDQVGLGFPLEHLHLFDAGGVRVPRPDETSQGLAPEPPAKEVDGATNQGSPVVSLAGKEE